MAVGFAGPVGFGYSVVCGVIGYDPIAGVSLTPEERIASVAPVVVVGAIAKIGSKLSGLAERAAAAGRLNAERAAVVDAERAIAEASKAAAVGGIGRDVKVGEAAARGLAGEAQAVEDVAAGALGREAGAAAAERAGASLPGSAGIVVSRRLSPGEVAALSEAHEIEFALVYRAGPGHNGGGGQYLLFSGESRSVQLPLDAGDRLIYHTHPGGTPRASGADMSLLDLLGQTGSPQRSSQIVLPSGQTLRFGGIWGDRGVLGE
jgi:hypothetical protein